jgi:hypothetical protein
MFSHGLHRMEGATFPVTVNAHIPDTDFLPQVCDQAIKIHQVLQVRDKEWVFRRHMLQVVVQRAGCVCAEKTVLGSQANRGGNLLVNELVEFIFGFGGCEADSPWDVFCLGVRWRWWGLCRSRGSWRLSCGGGWFQFFGCFLLVKVRLCFLVFFRGDVVGVSVFWRVGFAKDLMKSNVWCKAPDRERSRQKNILWSKYTYLQAWHVALKESLALSSETFCCWATTQH